MTKDKDLFLPNLTLDQAREMISKWQRKYDDAIQQKFHAQNIAFDLMFPDKKTSELEEVKAFAFYWQEELKKAIGMRDKVKRELEELRAEHQLLKVQLKNALKGGG